MLTKGAIGNLINRYRVAGMLVMGAVGLAVAADPVVSTWDKKEVTIDGTTTNPDVTEGAALFPLTKTKAENTGKTSRPRRSSSAAGGI
ncbi:hypothetical protein [Desulfovibrio sp. ZJ200]|uniref:hypothetical protein n=1 Tax=Desulfovibrio sp. ZJ200 TaxID=2709792 RepID=UPI0013EA750B|nr:hypothetical protein [Desulfovibrio sp. ZJ200]